MSVRMLLYNGALVIFKKVISLNVCAMSTVLLYLNMNLFNHNNSADDYVHLNSCG